MSEQQMTTASADGRVFRVRRDGQGQRAGIERAPVPEPGDGEVLIRVAWSGINYKDALAVTGRGRILRRFPLIPGIDAAGTVAASRHPGWREGDAVLAVGWGIGVERDGGYAEWLSVPGDWLVPMPAGLDARTAMILGTAGFTAALALHRMRVNGQHPGLGPILINGASGGVGSLAIAIFARLGYEVVAISGKPELRDWLLGLGAREVLGREALDDAVRPLESARWGGAVDNVGGELLARIARTVVPWGNIAAIGLAGGHEFPGSVMPFILRGVSLLGCNSAEVPQPLRGELWRHLADDWRPADLEVFQTGAIGLEELPATCESMLASRTHGRILVRPAAAEPGRD